MTCAVARSMRYASLLHTVMAGLVPATPIVIAQPCHMIGVAGTSPAMTAVGEYTPSERIKPSPVPRRSRGTARRPAAHRPCCADRRKHLVRLPVGIEALPREPDLLLLEGGGDLDRLAGAQEQWPGVVGEPRGKVAAQRVRDRDRACRRLPPCRHDPRGPRPRRRRRWPRARREATEFRRPPWSRRSLPSNGMCRRCDRRNRNSRRRPRA